MKTKIIRCVCFVIAVLLLIFSLYLRHVTASNRVEEIPTERIETSTTESLPIEPLPEMYYDCPLDEELQDYIRKICESYDVPMSLVLAVISVESSFRADAISKTGDYGLMQINVVNHEWLAEEYGITDFLDPCQNVFCGVAMLSQHLDRYGDETKALMAYHHGATGAKRLWDKGVYATEYTNRILELKEKYDNEIK